MTVLPADEEPADTSTAMPADGSDIDEGTAADWLPGIRDEHEDEAGWQARWLDRPTWDRTVTPEHPQADRTATGAPPLIRAPEADLSGLRCPGSPRRRAIWRADGARLTAARLRRWWPGHRASGARRA